MFQLQESQYSVGSGRIQIGAMAEGFDVAIEPCDADRLDEVARLRSRAFGTDAPIHNWAAWFAWLPPLILP
jgi:hypothetical protein